MLCLLYLLLTPTCRQSKGSPAIVRLEIVSDVRSDFVLANFL